MKQWDHVINEYNCSNFESGLYDLLIDDLLIDDLLLNIHFPWEEHMVIFKPQ